MNKTLGLDAGLLHSLLLEATGAGLALFVEPNLNCAFCNKRFATWFPKVDENPAIDAETLLPNIDFDRARATLEHSDVFVAELAVKVKRRPLSLVARVQRQTRGDEQFLLVEIQNNTKVKELEHMIESYSAMIERQNRSLAKEKERAEKLLLNIMPRAVYEELKTFGVTTPQRYENASVLMLDFVGFAARSMEADASELVGELNDLYTNFDRIAEQFGCERIKTTGDAYMAVSGVPEETPDHAHNIARTALLFRRYLQRRNQNTRTAWEFRMGISTGSVIGSVVGVQRYVYDIFGVAVNIAARCEAMSGPMEITMSESTAERISDTFRIAPAGEFQLKGIGTQSLYKLLGSGEAVRADADVPFGRFPLT